MSDNTTLPGAGDTVRDIDRGGVKTQVMQIDAGGQSEESLVSAANPLPVAEANIAAAQSGDQPLYTTLVGDPNGDWAGVPLLEQVIDDGSGIGVNVKVMNAPKLDANGAIVLSDCAGPFFAAPTAANQAFVFDTLGYSTAVIQVSMSNCIASMSSDMMTWSSVYAFTPTGVAAVNYLLANMLNHISTSLRYLRIVSGSAGSIVVTLKAGLPFVGANVVAVAGSQIASGGYNSNNQQSMPVGGHSLTGTSATTNAVVKPVVVGGVDGGTRGVNTATPTIRQLLTDNQGRLRLAQEGVVQDPNAPFLNVRDSTQGFDGQAIVDVLSQLLAESRIQTEYLFALVSMGTDRVGDPDDYRNNPNIFIQ